MFEENLRRALVVSRGDPMIFVERPISAVLLGIAATLVVVSLLPSVGSKRKKAFTG
jgi:TctA family transporter